MSPAYAALIARARPRSQLWRTVLGFGLIVATYGLWMVAIGVGLWLLGGLDGLESHLARMARAADPGAVVLMLASFAGAWLGVWWVLRVLHGRGLASATGRPALVLRDFVAGVAILTLVGGALTLAMLPVLPALELNLPPQEWARWLSVAVLGLLIQTGAEELVFRGYVQGQLAARFGRPLIYLTVPTILFGLAHYGSASGGDLWLMVLAAGLFGLVASDLTARTGSLGLAWGLHFANNAMAILVLSLSNTLTGLALFRVRGGPVPDTMLRPLMLADMAVLALVWLACVAWLRRR